LTMGHRRNRGDTRESANEQAMRDQEVLRANRELSAYFRGRRTEREARAALKIIKAFVRDRERLDPKSRPALPRLGAAKMPKKLTNREAPSDTDERNADRLAASSVAEIRRTNPLKAGLA
jgi:hypothetical protein